MKEIYLDNAATTRPSTEVIEAMARVMAEGLGNPSSLHRPGVAAAERIERATRIVRQAVGSGTWRVVFTSGGTESDNLAVLGTAKRGKRNRIVTTGLEHPAVEGACRQAAALGAELTVVSAAVRGVVDVDELVAAVDERTSLVSVIHVSNELGTLQPVEAIAKRVKQKAPRCRVHVDGVQAFAQLAGVTYPDEVDMVSLSSHKIHGPGGVGALLLRPEVTPRPLLFGGDQQGQLRPGTLNLAGIVGFGTAVSGLSANRREGAARMGGLTDRLVEGVTSGCDGIRPLGDPRARAPGIVTLAVDRVPGEVLLHTLELHGIVAASGAACHASRRKPSAGLIDAGLRDDQGAVRMSLSMETTTDEIDAAIGAICAAVEAVRKGRTGR